MLSAVDAVFNELPVSVRLHPSTTEEDDAHIIFRAHDFATACKLFCLNSFFSEEEEALFEETVEAFNSQVQSDSGDTEGRQDLEDRLESLLGRYQLAKEGCLAHLTRNSSNRGAGWRGGKGSLCRALLNSGCKKSNMHKVRNIYLIVYVFDPYVCIAILSVACYRSLVSFS